MRSLWLALALSLCASAAEAQIQQGSFKLSIDTDVLNFAVQNTEESEQDYTETRSTFSIGPGGSLLLTGQPGYVGFSLGYVAHPHVIPQLRLSITNASGSSEEEYDGESEDADLPSISAIMLQPEVEIPFNPGSGVVAFGLLGLDYRRLSIEDDEGEDMKETRSAIGPVFGAGMHVFAGEGIASFDLSAQFSYLVVNSETEIEGESEESELDVSVSTFSIIAGFSLWP